MTNAEKFEEVFGIKVDKCPDDPCSIADDKYCDCSVFSKKPCDKCELYHFWSKEYIKTCEDRENISKIFLLGVLFGTVATSDETLSLVMKQLEDMEVK